MDAEDAPTRHGAYMDNRRRIWLLEPYPPSTLGKWRLPGGSIVMSGSAAFTKVLGEITELRRMVPVRRK